MTSKREDVLSGLFALLSQIPGPTILRNEPLQVDIPAGGILNLRDGSPGEPEVTLSPLVYHFEHRAEIEVLVEGPSGRDAAFDAIAQRIGALIAAHRTLGGRCDWAEAEAPEPADLPVAGGAPIKAAVIPVMLHYSTSDPLI